MIGISSNYHQYLDDVVNEVTPVVTATWADSRIMDNLVYMSSSDLYDRTTKNLSPSLAWRMDNESANLTVGNTITCKFATEQIGQGIVFRYKDSQNYWFIRNKDGFGLTTLWKVVGGSTTLMKSSSSFFTAGSIVTVILDANSAFITVKQNGITLFTCEDNYLSNYAPFCGLIADSSVTSAARWDDFQANYIFDSFDRANNASAIGTSFFGQTWTSVVGTWGINTNQVYRPTSGAAEDIAIISCDLIEDTSGHNRHGYASGLSYAQADIREDASTLYPGSSLFTTAGSSFIFANDDTGLNPTDNFVLEAWVYFNTATLPFDSSEYVIAGKGTGFAITNNNAQYSITVENSILRGNVYIGSTRYQLSHSAIIDTSTKYYVAIVVMNGNFYFVVNDTIYGPTVLSGAINVTNGAFGCGRWGTLAATIMPNAKIEAVALFNLTEGSTFTPLAATSRYLCGSNAGDYEHAFYYCDGADAGNGRTEHSFLWAIADAKDTRDNTISANGFYYLAEKDYNNKLYEYGWWSRSASNALTGEFDTPELILLEFDQRKANYIDLYTPADYGKIRMHDIGYKDSTGTWITLETDDEMMEDDTVMRHDLGGIIDIQGVFVRVKSTWNLNDVARIQEIAPIFVEDVSADVVNLSINKIRDNYDTTVPLGITGSNSLTLTLQNADRKYNKFNTGSTLYGYLNPEVKFEISMSFTGPAIDGGGPADTGDTGTYGSGTYGSGTYGTLGTPDDPDSVTTFTEVIPAGTFWVDTIGNDTSGMQTTFNCRDESKYLQDTTIEGVLYKDVTASQAIGNLARTGGIYNSHIDIQERYADLVNKYKPYSYWRFNELSNSQLAVALTNNVMGNLHYTTNYPSTTTSGLSWKPYLDMTHQLQFYIAFWVKSTASSGTGDVFQIKDSTGVNMLKFNNLSAAAITVGATVFSTGLNFQDGTWHHCLVLIDQADFYVYKDGVLGYSSDNNTYTPWKPHGGDIRFGSSSTVMTITDIRMVNDFITSSDVQDLMNTIWKGHEENMIAFWPMKEDVSVSTFVEFINNYTYTAYWLADVQTTVDTKLSLQDAAVYKYKDLNNRLNLVDYTETSIEAQVGPLINDEINQSVLLASGSTIKTGLSADMRAMEEITFAGFIKLNDISSSCEIISDSSHTTGGIIFSVATDQSLGLQVLGSTRVATSTGVITTDVWHHVGFSIQKDTTAGRVNIYIYLNGQLLKSSTNNSNAYSTFPLIPSSLTMGGTLVGFISEFSLFDYILTSNEMHSLWMAGQASKQILFPYVWALEQTSWDAMLEIATADLGMFNIDENDDFIYETGKRFYDTIYPQHANVQWTLNDTDYIQNGDENIEIMANKITCKVYNVVSGEETISVWRPPSDETLAITSLSIDIDSYSTTIKYNSQEIPGTGQYIPIFPEGGFIRIDEELIQYTTSDKQYLYGCIRGIYDTTASYHASGSGLYEAKVYNITYDEKPLAFVKPPFSTSVFAEKARIHKWTTTPFGGQLIMSAVDSVITPHYNFLDGTEPSTNLPYFLGVAGIKIASTNSNEAVTTLSSDLKNQIRRYRIKALDIDNQFVSSKEQAQEIIDFLITHFKDGVTILNVSTTGLPHLQLSDRIKIGSFAQMNIVNKEFWIIQNNLNYDGALTQEMVVREVV